MTNTTIIAGAGIAGLTVAYELQKRNMPYLLLEAGPEVGGVVRSLHKNGFELDAGPNSIGATSATLAFFREIGLEQELLEATAAGKNRFLVRHGRLHPVSPNPVKILSSPYLSGAAKWRLFTERFRAPQPPAAEESVTAFVSRRFNREICDYLFDPILSGIYAGDPARLSVNEVLPFLPKWEQDYGSVTKGLFRNKGLMAGRKIVAFKGGNQVLVQRLQALLREPPRYNCRITGVERAAAGYAVKYDAGGQTETLSAARVLFTTPAYATAAALQGLDPALAQLLHAIHYPRMGVLHLGFDREAVRRMPQGFGFLVPAAAQLHFLGAICNSEIFPSRAPAGQVLFTVFTGGVQQEHFFDEMNDDALQQKILEELTILLQLQRPPVMQHFSRWEKAIPQLNTGHRLVRAAVQDFEQRFPGMYISGNYLSGVAIPAIIQHAAALAEKLWAWNSNG
ncbi:protoporphyrinogen oxidase [Chitinophaga japonensis]|uniref:Coproporphyrinogen III oxidase n=1 Tax=Chitinophaga japonensis TaxID=104662 RepID=A0A562SLE3_CHIJA|nr:protoporphyrinogen oxidase [Chitinophaga japonensis]TWI82042.1 oxygen-dependent protoporphyrinogen oxidase [Chitinophaga japonensis]